jgi:hypothetical protein
MSNRPTNTPLVPKRSRGLGSAGSAFDRRQPLAQKAAGGGGLDGRSGEGHETGDRPYVCASGSRGVHSWIIDRQDRNGAVYQGLGSWQSVR